MLERAVAKGRSVRPSVRPSVRLSGYWRGPEGPCPPANSECPRRFWCCSLTHAPTLGYMNVFSDGVVRSSISLCCRMAALVYVHGYTKPKTQFLLERNCVTLVTIGYLLSQIRLSVVCRL